MQLRSYKGVTEPDFATQASSGAIAIVAPGHNISVAIAGYTVAILTIIFLGALLRSRLMRLML